MRITNVDTLSSLIDRLITENIKLFFFAKGGELVKVAHQKEVIAKIKDRMSKLFLEATERGYEYTGERRTFNSEFSEHVQELILNDIRIGEADRARLEEVTSEEPDFYRMAFNEIRLRIANEGRAKNKNNIDESFKGMTSEE
jgi:hypothetical protein